MRSSPPVARTFASFVLAAATLLAPKGPRPPRRAQPGRPPPSISPPTPPGLSPSSPPP